MNPGEILQRLVEIARSGDYSEIAQMADPANRSSARRVVMECRDDMMSFAKALPLDERVAFIKSIAMLEHYFGGLGSVTNLTWLLPLVSDAERNVLDWVLRNTKSYRYYSHGARSADELDLVRRRIADHSAERIRRDQERQLQDKKQIAEAATRNLHNAVRRGDIKAVRALIHKGANVKAPGSDGSAPVTLALSMGYDEIAAELRNAGAD